MLRSRGSASPVGQSTFTEEDSKFHGSRSRYRILDGVLLIAVVVVFIQFVSQFSLEAPVRFPTSFFNSSATADLKTKPSYEAIKAKLSAMSVPPETMNCPQSFIDQFPEQEIDYSRVHKSNFHGMKGEDKFLYQYFFSRKQSPGTFIEIGGVDGIGLSNSLVFERDLGWRGVLIEPQTTNYAKLEVNRPDSTTLHAAVCLEPGLIQISGEGGQAVQNEKGTSWALCEPMKDLLARTPIDHVDLYSIDVEGGELDLIISHDWEKVPAFSLIVEMRDYPRLRELNRLVTNALYSAGLCRFASNVGHYNEVWVNMSYPIDLAPIS